MRFEWRFDPHGASSALVTVSGAFMVVAYEQAVPQSKLVKLANIGLYPQTEAPQLVLKSFKELYKSVRD